jgi:hypothetical protein
MEKTTQIVKPAESWLISLRGSIHGPFAREQIVGRIMAKLIGKEAFLKREDWQEWRPLMECLDHLANDVASRKTVEPYKQERRLAAPRVELEGNVRVSDGLISAEGYLRDASISGLFVKTAERRFRLGDIVALDIHGQAFKQPIQGQAEVMRYCVNPKFPIGFGLRFTAIDNKFIAEVARLVGYRHVVEFGIVYNDPFNNAQGAK